MKRHKLTRCKHEPQNTDISYKELFYEMKNELNEEKIKFSKQISVLLDKVGNTTNNYTQNIQLNSYGNEDITHITDKLKNEMLKLPFTAIPRMIEEIHFNNDKPENKNIELTNIRDNKVKIYSDKGWIYKDKDETINDLVNGKYLILDNHYQNSEECIDENDAQSFQKFKSYYSLGDKNLVEKLKKDCELILLNNR